MEPLIELLNSLLPEWIFMEIKCLNHDPVLVAEIDKALTILLWTHDILRISLLRSECHDLTIFPWSWD